MRKFRNYWTKERCIEDAKKFSSKIEWKCNSSSSYARARKLNCLDLCCSHMTKLGSKFLRLVYVFEFSDKSVYVGLTYNPNERKKQHLFNKNGVVYKHSSLINEKPIFKEVSDFIDKVLASNLEGEILLKYKENGWNILNKTKTGALGGDTLMWTKEKCIFDAKKYKRITEWNKKSVGAYTSAKKHGWFNDCITHMDSIKRPNGYWNYEKCLIESNRFETLREWKLKSPSSLVIARRNGWVDLLMKS